MKSTIPTLILCACAPDVPDAPSFQQHVAPILSANCVRCHGVPVLGGAPAGFRLDTYLNYERPSRNDIGTETVGGAKEYSAFIAARVTDDENPMPPRFGLDDYQIATLESWDALGAPRGEPNADNRLPTATVASILRSVEEAGLQLKVQYLIDIDVRDPDPDIVGGGLAAKLGTTVMPLGLLRSGRNRVVWDTTEIARAPFSLEARLDDGAGEIVVQLGNLDVEEP